MKDKNMASIYKVKGSGSCYLFDNLFSLMFLHSCFCIRLTSKGFNFRNLKRIYKLFAYALMYFDKKLPVLIRQRNI